LRTPTLQVYLPVIETINQEEILQKIQAWMKNQGIPAQRASRLVQINNPYFVSVNTRSLFLPQRNISIQGSNACPGQWNLSSRLVLGGNGRDKLWHIRLEGRGFTLQADRMLRVMLLQQLKKHNLLDQLKLKDYRWSLPESDLNGRVIIDFYFSFTGKQVELPSLIMKFVKLNGAIYSRRTPSLSLQSKVHSLPESLALTARDRHIYLSYNRKPSTERAEKIDIWAYQVAENFPIYPILARRWNFLIPLALRSEQKTANITQRSSRSGPFGQMVQVFTQTIPLESYYRTNKGAPTQKSFCSISYGKMGESVVSDFSRKLTRSFY